MLDKTLALEIRKRIKYSYLTSTLLSMALGLILGILLLLFGREFLSLFSSDAAVIDAGLNRVNTMALSLFLSALMDCSIAASRAIHKTAIPTFIVIMGSCVFRILWVKTVFAFIGTIPSLYLLYPFSFIITGVAEIAYFVYCYKKLYFKSDSIINSHKSSLDMNGKPYFKEINPSFCNLPTTIPGAMPCCLANVRTLDSEKLLFSTNLAISL